MTASVHLLTYGCAYTPRWRSSVRHSSSSSSSRTNTNDRPIKTIERRESDGCQQLAAVSSVISGLFGSTEHGSAWSVLSGSNDVSGQLCHCHTDRCNPAPTCLPFTTAILFMTAVIAIIITF